MAQERGSVQLHAAQQPSPAEVLMLDDGENQEQLLVSFQEYQKNKKMVPSLCAPKASSSFSLSATQMAIIPLCVFSLELFQCIALMLCRSLRIRYKCSSLSVDQRKSSDGAVPPFPTRKRGEESQPQTPPCTEVLHTWCSAASQSPAEGLVSSP